MTRPQSKLAAVCEVYHPVSLVVIFWKAGEQIHGKSKKIDVKWEESWTIYNIYEAERGYFTSVVDLAMHLPFL